MTAETTTKPAQIYTTKYSTIDHKNSEKFKDSVLELIVYEQNLTLILDLSIVKEMYSSGIGVLIFLDSYLKDNNGELKLIGLNKNLRERFGIKSLDKIFKFYATIEDAQKST